MEKLKKPKPKKKGKFDPPETAFREAETTKKLKEMLRKRREEAKRKKKKEAKKK